MQSENNSSSTEIQLGLDGDHAHIEITKQLQHEFNKLYSYIIAAIKKAKENNKPFVLLVGEDHASFQSLFFKNLIIDMAKHLGISTVGYETTTSEIIKTYMSYNLGYCFLEEALIERLFLSQSREELAKLNPQSMEHQQVNKERQKWIRKGQDGLERNYLRTLNYIEEKKMKLIPIDDPGCQEHQVAISEEGIQRRDAYMSSILSVLINDHGHNTEDLIAIVGSAHLPGISSYLSKKYFVLTIDVADYTKTRKSSSKASIFIDREDVNVYEVLITNQFKQNILDQQEKSVTNFYTPSQAFFEAMERESLKKRAALGIPRTVSLLFYKAKSFLYSQSNPKPSKISMM